MGFDSDSFDTGAYDINSFDFVATPPPPAPPVYRAGRRPVTRSISVRALVFALDGPEKPYPVYRFARKFKLERPKHNPFRDA
jgi:hypothetical protein